MLSDQAVDTLCDLLLYYKSRGDKLESQLPKGMKHCTIVAKQCELGHSWLTATNWVQHGCPTCEKNRLREQLGLQQEQLDQQPKKQFKDYPIPESAISRFAETEFLVEATDFERSTLWETWHKRVSSWQRDNLGCIQIVGELDNRTINLSISWAIINNHRILFWNCVSAVFDYKQVQEWFDLHCSRPTTTAQNFHVALQHLKINYSTDGL